jgi:hypothetical protein
MYFKVGDTADLQHAILNGLLAQQTKEAFIAFKDLMLQEPPIAEEQFGGYTSYPPLSTLNISRITSVVNYRSRYGKWSELYDTLSLTKLIFPDFLQLMTIDDYKDEVMNVLTVMVDSGYLKASDYETYFSKIYLDAKQVLKQIAKEEKAR